MNNLLMVTPGEIWPRVGGGVYSFYEWGGGCGGGMGGSGGGEGDF